MPRTKTLKKTLKITASVLWWALTLSLALLVINIFSAKIKGKVPSVLGYSVMHIVSGSMEDEIPTGTYILIRKTDAKKIRKDDIICFYSQDPAIYGYPNTHRVVEEPIVTDDGFEFVTKGDANHIKDAYNVREADLIGKYVGRLDFLKSFSEMLEKGGMFVIILVMLLLTVGVMSASLVIKAKALPKETSENCDDEYNKSDPCPEKPDNEDKKA